MARHFIFPALVLVALAAAASAEEVIRTGIRRAWAGGFQGYVEVPVNETMVNDTTREGGWHMKIDFDYNVYDFDASCWADVVELHPEEGDKSHTLVILKNPWHSPELEEGTFKFYFLAKTWKRRKGFRGDVLEFNVGPYIPPPPPLPPLPVP